MTVKEIILLIVGVLLAVFTGLIPLFKKLAKKTETKVDDHILELAIKSVQYIDTYFLNSSNTSKKLRAMDILEIILGQEGTKVSNEVLDRTIEKAVSVIKIAEIEKKKEETQEGTKEVQGEQ